MFRMDEDLERWVGEVALDLDCSLSDLIRISVLLAVPIIKEYPYMIKILPLNDLGRSK